LLVIREGAKLAAAVAGRRRRVDCTVTFASGIVTALAVGVEAAAVDADADTDEEMGADEDLGAMNLAKPTVNSTVRRPPGAIEWQ
jgi:hypothetical protein